MLDELKAKIASVESEANQAMANHNFLSGALAALKEALVLAESIAPKNPVVEAVAEAVVIGEAIEQAVDHLSDHEVMSN